MRDAHNVVENATTDDVSTGNQELAGAFARCDVAKEKYDLIFNKMVSLNEIINVVALVSVAVAIVVTVVFVESPLWLLVSFLMMMTWFIPSSIIRSKIEKSEEKKEFDRSLVHLRDVAVADIMDRYNIELINMRWWNKDNFYNRKMARGLDVTIDPERTAVWDAVYHKKHRRMYLRSDVGSRYMPSDVAK